MVIIGTNYEYDGRLSFFFFFFLWLFKNVADDTKIFILLVGMEELYWSCDL